MIESHNFSGVVNHRRHSANYHFLREAQMKKILLQTARYFSHFVAHLVAFSQTLLVRHGSPLVLHSSSCGRHLENCPAAISFNCQLLTNYFFSRPFSDNYCISIFSFIGLCSTISRAVSRRLPQNCILRDDKFVYIWRDQES